MDFETTKEDRLMFQKLINNINSWVSIFRVFGFKKAFKLNSYLKAHRNAFSLLKSKIISEALSRFDELSLADITSIYVEVYSSLKDSTSIELKEESINNIDDIEQLKEDVKGWEEILKAREDIRLLLIDIFLLELWYFQYALELKQSDERYIAISKKLRNLGHDSELSEINFKELELSLLNRKSEHKSIDKDIRSKIKARTIESAKSVIGEYKFSIDQIIPWMTLFGSVLVISGFYYINSLLANFGINSEEYFNFSDYLSSSIVALYLILIGTSLSLFILFVGIHFKLDEVLLNNDLDLKTNFNKNDKWILVILLISISGFILNSLLDDYSAASNALRLVIFIIGLYAINIIPFERYIKNDFTVRLILMVLLFLYIGLEKQIQDDTMEVRETMASSIRVIYADGERVIDSERYSLITSNNKYFFFFDKKDQTSLIVQRDKFKTVTFSTPDEQTNFLQDFLKEFNSDKNKNIIDKKSVN